MLETEDMEKEEMKIEKMKIEKMKTEELAGIMQKGLKILVINGCELNENGSNCPEIKALVKNGTSFEPVWSTANNFWMNPKSANIDVDLESEGMWDGYFACCGVRAGSIRNFVVRNDNLNQVSDFTAGADVVVVVNLDELEEGDLNSEYFRDMMKCKPVISYGNKNKKFDKFYKDNENFKYLESEEGCRNLLDYIQHKGGESTDSKNKLKAKNKLKSKEEITKVTKYVGIRRYLRKMKQYAKKYPNSTVAGGVAGAGVLEELFGKLLFGKSILGGIFGYNSNPKEKDAKNVKDNKKDEKKSDKKVNNSGNQVK